ncbi:MAG: ABC transporter permease [Hyphomicrobiaceae bacterium]
MVEGLATLPAERGTWTRCLRNWRVAVGGGLLALLLLVAIFAPLLAPFDPLEQDLVAQLEGPSWSLGHGHVLGADSLGRDLLSRLIFGARIALTVAIAAAVPTMLIGTLLGLIAGYLGGVADAVISRLIDVWTSFPPVLLSIILVALIGTGLYSVIIAIIVIDWTRFARVVRAETLKQRRMDYADAAVISGQSPKAILFREILPNILPLVLVLLTLEMGIAVIVEAILSFVGLSLSSDAPTWGGMIAEGRQVINQAPYILSLPMLAILATVLGLNLLGDGLKSELDPVLR